jgi:hypothetical protein
MIGRVDDLRSDCWTELLLFRIMVSCICFSVQYDLSFPNRTGLPPLIGERL